MSHTMMRTAETTLAFAAPRHRRIRSTGQMTAAELAENWTPAEADQDHVGLYRRFTLAAAERGWRLAPRDIETLLDIYVAYVRKAVTPTTDGCLRVLKRLRQHALR